MLIKTVRALTSRLSCSLKSKTIFAAWRFTQGVVRADLFLMKDRNALFDQSNKRHTTFYQHRHVRESDGRKGHPSAQIIDGRFSAAEFAGNVARQKYKTYR